MILRNCLAFLLSVFILSASVTDIAKAQDDSLLPILRSVSVDRADLWIGDTLRIRVGSSSPARFYVENVDYIDPNGRTSSVYTHGANERYLELDLREGQVLGNYSLSSVFLRERGNYSNFALYSWTGEVFSNTPGVPATHDLDFSEGNFSINATATTITGPATSVYGHEVVFDVSVTASRGTPTGTATLWFEHPNGGHNVAFGTATLSHGSARITTTGALMADNLHIHATYSGSAGHGPSHSASLPHTVRQADVHVELGVPSGTVRPGNTARLTATVNSLAPGGAPPVGYVDFYIDGSVRASGHLDGGRTAVNLPSLPNGEYEVVAEYTGDIGGYDSNHSPATSVARRLVIGAAMGPEITVNQRTSHNQQRPAISSLGRAAVVVYEDQLVAGGPFGITAQRVNWSGAANGNAIEVAPPAEGTGFPDVARMAGGSFVVVWEAAGQGGRQDIFMRRFRANGRAIDRAPQLVNDDRQGNQTRPRVAALEDGGYVVVWESDSLGRRGGIAGRLFESTGAPRTDEISLDDGRGPDVAVQHGGDIVVSWSQEMTGGAVGSRVLAHRISLQGTPIGNEIVLAIGAPRTVRVRLAALDNGNFAVAYEFPDHAAGYGVLVQRLRQRGPMWGHSVRMERVIDGDQRSPAITGLRRMGLVTAWRAPDGRLNGVWVQPLDRSGTPIGTPERANTTVPGNQFDPAVARVGTTRNYFVVWTASGAGRTEGTNIMIRRFMGP